MVEFNFYLSEEDTDRLFAIKKLRGKDELTGNEYARELLEGLLYHLFPGRPEWDEAGNVTNPERANPN